MYFHNITRLRTLFGRPFILAPPAPPFGPNAAGVGAPAIVCRRAPPALTDDGWTGLLSPAPPPGCGGRTPQALGDPAAPGAARALAEPARPVLAAAPAAAAAAAAAPPPPVLPKLSRSPPALPAAAGEGLGTVEAFPALTPFRLPLLLLLLLLLLPKCCCFQACCSQKNDTRCGGRGE